MLAASGLARGVPVEGAVAMTQLRSAASALAAAQKTAAFGLPIETGATGLPATDPRLETAAHQFEAAMMQELLGPLTKQMEGMDGMTGDEDDDGTNQALTSFASEALGEALSLHGGFGIASSVLKKLHAEVAERDRSVSGAGKGIGMGLAKRKRTTVGIQNRISSKTLHE